MLRFFADLVAPRSSVLLVWTASSSEKTAQRWLKFAEMPARENYSSDRVRPQRATAGAARKSWERARCVLQNNQLAACNTLGRLAVVRNPQE